MFTEIFPLYGPCAQPLMLFFSDTALGNLMVAVSFVTGIALSVPTNCQYSSEQSEYVFTASITLYLI